MKKNLKVFVSLLALTLVLGIQTTARAAEETTPAFAITEEAVIIDHVPYAIENGTIQYEGKTYEVQEDGVLATYDENGEESALLLPTEQYWVSDPERIAELDAAVANSNRRKMSRGIVYGSLPFEGRIPAGFRNKVMTAAFNIIDTCFERAIVVELSGFALFADKNFEIIFSTGDGRGSWQEARVIGSDLLKIRRMKAAFENFSTHTYGVFTINYLGDKSNPAYDYRVYIPEGPLDWI